MNKYLFLLGFFLFSISFLSGCKMSDFHSAPVTNADSAPVTNADSAPVTNADSAPATNATVALAYKGVVYDGNKEARVITCESENGLYLLQHLRNKIDGKPLQVPPADCTDKGISQFILFSKEVPYVSSSEYNYLAAFVYYLGANGWKRAYIEVNQSLQLAECENAPTEILREDCKQNIDLFHSHEKSRQVGIGTAKRSPDSIKE